MEALCVDTIPNPINVILSKITLNTSDPDGDLKCIQLNHIRNSNKNRRTDDEEGE